MTQRPEMGVSPRRRVCGNQRGESETEMGGEQRWERRKGAAAKEGVGEGGEGANGGREGKGK